MEKATISELKNSLSAYLKKVRAGQSILILDRNQPVARLERVVGSERGDERLDRLERAGLVRRPSAPLSLKELQAPTSKPRRSVTQALLEDRRDGR